MRNSLTGSPSTPHESMLWVVVRLSVAVWVCSMLPRMFVTLTEGFPVVFALTDWRGSISRGALAALLLVWGMVALLWQSARAIRAWTGRWVTMGLSGRSLERLEQYLVTPLLWMGLLLIYFLGISGSCLGSNDFFGCNTALFAGLVLIYLIAEGAKTATPHAISHDEGTPGRSANFHVACPACGSIATTAVRKLSRTGFVTCASCGALLVNSPRANRIGLTVLFSSLVVAAAAALALVRHGRISLVVLFVTAALGIFAALWVFVYKFPLVVVKRTDGQEPKQ